MFVIDTSIAMAWCFEDEATQATDAVLDLLRTDQAVVPTIWPLEVANVLLVAERRGRLSEAQASRFLELLAQLPINVDTSPTDMAGIVATGRRHTLSSYDAAYCYSPNDSGPPWPPSTNRWPRPPVRQASNCPSSRRPRTAGPPDQGIVLGAGSRSSVPRRLHQSVATGRNGQHPGPGFPLHRRPFRDFGSIHAQPTPAVQMVQVQAGGSRPCWSCPTPSNTHKNTRRAMGRGSRQSQPQHPVLPR